jgi:hypothetical protein
VQTLPPDGRPVPRKAGSLPTSSQYAEVVWSALAPGSAFEIQALIPAIVAVHRVVGSNADPLHIRRNLGQKAAGKGLLVDVGVAQDARCEHLSVV